MQKAVLNVLLSRPWGSALWSISFPNFYPSRKPADFAAYRAHLKDNVREPGRIEALGAMMNSSDSSAEGQSRHAA